MSFNSRLLWLVCFAFFILIAKQTFQFKTISYDKIPHVGETFDEYAWAWIGKSFLTGGLPVSWTTNLPSYKTKSFTGNLEGFNLRVNGVQPTWSTISQVEKPSIATLTFDYGLGDRYIDLVQPYLDHPPLAGVIFAQGIPDSLSNLLEIKATHFRYPLRFVSLFTAGTLLAFGGLAFNPLVGLISAAVYLVTPSSVLGSRLALAENILTPLLLLTISFTILAVKTRLRRFIIAAGVTAGLALLTKFSGITAVISGLLVLWHYKQPRTTFVYFLIAAFLVGSCYILYALYLSPQLFFSVLNAQSLRTAIGPIGLYQGLQRIFFRGFPLDGWWVGGFAVLCYLTSKSKYRVLSLIGLSYALIVVLLGGDFNSWYFIPLSAIFCLGYGLLAYELLIGPNCINSTLFFLFPVMTTYYWGYLVFHSGENSTWPIRIFALGFIGASIVVSKYSSRHTIIVWAWIIFWILLIHRLYLWNFRSIQFILSNWDTLPFPFMWHSLS